MYCTYISLSHQRAHRIQKYEEKKKKVNVTENENLITKQKLWREKEGMLMTAVNATTTKREWRKRTGIKQIDIEINFVYIFI